MEIVITRKKIKNIIFKISKEGNLLISAPKNISQEYINELILRKKGWIEKKIEIVVANSKHKKIYADGEKFIFLGKIYILKITISENEQCKIEGENFIVKVQENSFERKKNIIFQWLKYNFCNLMIELTEEIGEIVGYKPNNIKFRVMTTRWGSCNAVKRSITYNMLLFEKPLDVIRYVILHELAHIPYPHHKKDFWDFVEIYMPNWKELRKKLK